MKFTLHKSLLIVFLVTTTGIPTSAIYDGGSVNEFMNLGDIASKAGSFGEMPVQNLALALVIVVQMVVIRCTPLHNLQ